MKVVSQSDLKYLSCLSRKSRAGDVYYYVNLFDGVSTLELFASEEIAKACATHAPMDTCSAEFEISKRDKGTSVFMTDLFFC